MTKARLRRRDRAAYKNGGRITIDDFLTIRKAADVLNIPECFIRREVKKENVPGFFSENRFYVNVPAFKAKLDASSAADANAKKAEREESTTVKDGQEMFSRVEDITPETAKAYLEKSAGNRPLSQVTVKNYACDMISGKWELTSQGITFNERGILTDGHHRLHAIIKAGVTVRMNVTYNEPAGTFIHDRGRIRTQANVLQMMGLSGGFSHSSTVGAVNFMFTIAGNTHVTDTLMYDFCTENQEILNKVSSVTRSGKAHGVCRKSPIIAAAFCAMYCGVSEDALRDFFNVANTGFSLSEKQNAAIVLRNFIMQGTLNESHGTTPKKRTFAVATNAIRDFVKQNPRRRLYKPDVEPAYFQRVREGLIDKYLGAYQQLTAK